MKNMKKYLALAVVGGLIFFSSGTLTGYKYARKTCEPQSIEDLVELKNQFYPEDIIKMRQPYIQSLFDKKISKIQSGNDDVVTIKFEDRSELEIWYDVTNNKGGFPSDTEFIENNFTYKIEDVTETTPDRKRTIYMPEDLTPIEKMFYKSILKNISFWNCYRANKLKLRK